MKWFLNLKLSLKLLLAIVFSAVIGSVIGYLGNDVQNNSTAIFIFVIVLGVVLLAAVCSLLKRSIGKPISELTNKLDRLTKGDLDILFGFERNDEFGGLEKSFSSLLRIVKSLNNEASELSSSIDKGILNEHIDIRKYNGCWNSIAESYNKNIDAIVTPINEAMKIMERLAVNDYSMKISSTYKGTLQIFTDNINTVISRLLSVQDAFERVAKGDLSRLEEFRKIGRRSENDKLMPAMIAMLEAIDNTIHEINIVSSAVYDGKLDIRSNSDKFEGGYKTIINQINTILNSIEKPLNSSVKVLNRLSVYDFTMSMDNSYNGIFGDFAKAVNNVQDHLFKIENIVTKISDGDLSDLQSLKSIGKRSENDHLVPAFVKMMETINTIINDIEEFTRAAVDGQLSKRGNPEKYHGVYMEIIKGLNMTLDAVVMPLNEASEVLQEMAKGNLEVKVTGDYKGDHATIKNALNITISTLRKYIGEISRVLAEVANGNFDLNIDEDFNGDFLIIKKSLIQILDSLNEVFSNINAAADQVAAGSRQVSASSQVLSQGSTEQASAIEEVTSSVTQASEQTRQNAGNANQANDLALSAKEIAVNGNAQMQGMVKAMAEINDSSANISKIIKVIDEIAFQTNILALNAAVEAARAGQHGKGFAVVAEEVRNLAARSANAAKETTGMIEGSIKKVEVGTRIANETAEELNKIVDAVSKAAVLVGHIATASNEQATGIAQINQAIVQVSEVVQTNSATSQECAAASEELSSQADMLKDSIAKVKLKKVKLNNHNGVELNADMFKMFGDMVNKSKQTNNLEFDVRPTNQNPPPNLKISLVDDFGKY